MTLDEGPRLRLRNNGRAVWLFDDSHCDLIQRSGAMRFGEPGADVRYRAIAKDGLLVGYELERDEDLDVCVFVGPPFGAGKPPGGRWYEPQHGWLRLPSGVFCVNSSETAHAEAWRAGTHGAHLELAPGNYIVTLYRINRAALRRERRDWRGPHEVIVLTRGGTNLNGVPFVLPFPGARRSAAGPSVAGAGLELR